MLSASATQISTFIMSNITSRFIVFDDGMESDWVYPALAVNESDDSWFVDNGFNVYEIPKIFGRTVMVQQRSE